MRFSCRAAVIACLAWGCAERTTRAPSTAADVTPLHAAEGTPSAPAVLVAHLDGSLHTHPGGGFSGSGDIGFESASCCGIGAYVATSAFRNDEVGSVLHGGLQLEVVAPLEILTPSLRNLVRFRGRVGKAGTEPKNPSLGRNGFAASLVGLVRIWSPETPPLNAFGGDVDLFVGYSNISLLEEDTTAGPMLDRERIRGVAIGLRLGVEYGVEFR